MPGKPAKVKGSSFEREIVKLLRDAGVEARRVPLSGAAQGFKGDVKFICLGQPVTAECKRRRSGFKTLYAWLGDNECLFLRDDNRGALVVLRAADFARLAMPRDGTEQMKRTRAQRLAEMLPVLLRPNCRDSLCMCSEDRDRFDCLFYPSAETIAEELLEAMRRIDDEG